MAIGRKTALGCGAIFGTIVLGAVGSGVWEIVARPGVNRVSNLLTSLFTFGSQRLRDLPFESAALDPTPLSSLIIVFLLSCIPSFLIGSIVAATMSHRTTQPLRQQLAEVRKIVRDQKETIERKHETVEKLSTRLRKWRLVSVLLFILLLIGGTIFAGVAYSILNRAIIVWRVYHANERICAPYMTPEQRLALDAEFASMKTQSDYIRVRQEQNALAKQYNLQLIADGVRDTGRKN